MNKNSLKFIIFVLLICGTVFNIVMIIILPEINPLQTITLINPKPGIHIIETPIDRKYIQLKISNCSSGTFAVSLEFDNFKEEEESK